MGRVERKSAPAKWDLNDLLALQALAALEGPYVPWTAWSMRPSAIATIVNAILLGNVATVVELGSGTSTVYAGRALRERAGTLVSIEEDADWAAAMRERVAADGLGDVVSVVHAPLAPHAAPDRPDWPADAPDRWYEAAAVDAAVPPAIDLLVVDGPAAGDDPPGLVRLPAVPALASRLGRPFAVVLDDAERPAEGCVAELWAGWLGVGATVNERTSLAVLRSDGGVFPDL